MLGKLSKINSDISKNDCKQLSKKSIIGNRATKRVEKNDRTETSEEICLNMEGKCGRKLE